MHASESDVPVPRFMELGLAGLRRTGSLLLVTMV